MKNNTLKKITKILILSFFVSIFLFPINILHAKTLYRYVFIPIVGADVILKDGFSSFEACETDRKNNKNNSNRTGQNAVPCESYDDGTGSSGGGSSDDINIDGKYTLLAPLPGFEPVFNAKNNKDCPLHDYLNKAIKLIIGLIAVIAVVMIIMGGIEYMTSELTSGKANGKEMITNALFGLLLALSSWLILNTINPRLLSLCLDGMPKIQISIDPDEIQGRLGNGKCEIPTNTNSLCHPSKLSAFGDKANQAAAICNGESRGISNRASTVDKGSDGNSFSFGLFQINIIAHGDKIGDGNICNNIFKVDPNPKGKVGNSQNDSTLGGCLERNNGICVKYAATVINMTRYNNCKNYITNIDNNIKYAAKLQKSSGWGQWGFNKSCKF